MLFQNTKGMYSPETQQLERTAGCDRPLWISSPHYKIGERVLDRHPAEKFVQRPLLLRGGGNVDW